MVQTKCTFLRFELVQFAILFLDWFGYDHPNTHVDLNYHLTIFFFIAFLRYYIVFLVRLLDSHWCTA
jgi:hypothetical protein